jgi:hypothetical protein
VGFADHESLFKNRGLGKAKQGASEMLIPLKKYWALVGKKAVAVVQV